MKSLLAAFLLASPPAPIAVQEVLRSSDRAVTVWNWNSGLGGTMPDWIQTVRWIDGDRVREQRFDSEHGRLGWIEAIGVFPTGRGTVYVLAGEDKWSAREHSLLLTAWRIRPGGEELEEAVGFFPSIPGVGHRNASIRWSYERPRRIDVFPRPVEVRFDGEGIDVHVFPRADAERGKRPVERMTRKSFRLGLVRDVIHPIDLDPDDLPALSR